MHGRPYRGEDGFRLGGERLQLLADRRDELRARIWRQRVPLGLHLAVEHIGAEVLRLWDKRVERNVM